jgi:hypothetical protein
MEADIREDTARLVCVAAHWHATGHAHTHAMHKHILRYVARDMNKKNINLSEGESVKFLQPRTSSCGCAYAYA